MGTGAHPAGRAALKLALASLHRIGGWLEDALDALVPDRCLACGEPIVRPRERSLLDPAAWCDPCLATVVPLGWPLCLDCPEDSSRWRCDRRDHLRVRAAVQYGEAVSALVTATKYQRNPALLVAWRETWTAAGRAASLVNEPAVRAHEPVDLLVPVPAHPARVRERGWDVADAWTRAAGAEEGLPVARALRRTRLTPPQVGSNRRHRRSNVTGAFGAGAEASTVRGRRVAVVDDVVTTGSTLGECAAALHDLGARSVVAWAFAYEPLE